MLQSVTRHVTIIGAGIVGLTLANALAQAGLLVTVIERRLPLLTVHNNSFNDQPSRVSALNRSSCDFLKKINAWQQIRPSFITGFSGIEAWVHDVASAIHFDAASKGKRYLGYIIENHELVRVLWEMAQANTNITIHCPFALTTLSDLENASYIIGADGAQSWVREQAGIDCYQRSYGQHAIVATVRTEKPHDFKARQRFLKTGPLGLLPLHDGHQASLVWSAQEDEANRLMSLDEEAFNRALSNATELQLGKITVMTKRLCIPLIMRQAKQYVTSAVILVGDAAHTIHPLAGQGVNLGLQDVMNLAQQLMALPITGSKANCIRALRTYERERRAAATLMQAAMLAFRLIKQPIGFALIDKCDALKDLFILQ